MITRSIEDTIRKSVSQVPVVTILGPRQARKTTLVKNLLSSTTVDTNLYNYISNNQPVIVLLKNGSTPHYVLVKGYNVMSSSVTYYINDPLYSNKLQDNAVVLREAFMREKKRN